MSKGLIKGLIASNLVLAGIAIAAFVMVVQLQQQQVKIAYVNNSQILSEYQGIVEGTAMLKSKMTQWQSNLDTLQAEINQELAVYKDGYSSLTPKERELTEELIRKKQETFFNYKKAIEEKRTEEDQKITSTVINQIDSYLLSYGENSEFDYIVGITDQGNLLYAKQQNDITEEVLTGLNKTYNGE